MRKRILVGAILGCVLLGAVLSTGATETKSFTAGSYYIPTEQNYYITEENITVVPTTIEAWLCVESGLSDAERGGTIFGNYKSTGETIFNLEVFTGTFPRVLVSAENGEVQSYVFNKVALPKGEFVHLTVVRDVEYKEMRCYINGELKQTLKLYGTQVTEVHSRFGIGSDLRSNSANYFKGEINDISVFNDVRTDEEIQADMNAISESASGLLANWNFDSFTSGQESVTDATGNYNLTLNAEWFGTFDDFNNEEYAYTIALVGDTQWLNKYHPEKYTQLYSWLANNYQNGNIDVALGLGDIVEHKDATSVVDEWARAKAAGELLNEAALPYTMIVGNHDLYSGIGNFVQAFPIENYNTKTYWGGSYSSDSIINSYYKLTLGNTNYLIFALEYGPRDVVLDWVGNIIEKPEYADYRVIITTHGYLRPDGTYLAPGNSGNAGSPSMAYGYNDGDDIWEQLGSQYENISMIICGHAGGNALVQQKVGINGNTVTEILHDATQLDAESLEQPGGMVFLLHFKPDENEVDARLYSTIRDQYYKNDYQVSFELDALDIVE